MPYRTLVDDMRLALRRLIRNRGSSLGIVLLVALGIGVASCMFTVAHALLWKPLPYPSEERLVLLKGQSLAMGIDLGWSTPYLDAVARGSNELDEVAAFRRIDVAVFDSEGGQTGVDDVVAAQPGLFRLLGAGAQAGRLLLPEDAAAGAERVAVVGASLARTRYGGAQALGQTIRVDGDLHRIVGVVDANFSFPDDDVQIWLPMAFSPADLAADRIGSFGSLGAIGRLAPGSTHVSASAEMMALARSGEPFTAIADQIRLQLAALPLRDLWLGEKKAAIGSMLLAAALVFVVAVANACNLFLLRVLRRRQESALLEVIGATGARRFAQTCWEALLACLAAAAIGTLLVPAGLALLRSHDVLPTGTPVDASPGAATALAIVALALLAALSLATTTTALRSADAFAVLRQTGNGQSPGTRAQRLRQGLLIGQTALACALLFGTALLARSSAQLLQQDLGFDRAGQLVGRIHPAAWSTDPPVDTLRASIAAWLDAVRQMPGVEAAALTTSLPFSDTLSTRSFRPPAALPDGPTLPQAYVSYVSEDYFAALGQRLLLGRGFSAAEARTGAPVAVIDALVVARHFADSDPIGKTIGIGDDASGTMVEATVVGVARGARQRSLLSRDEYPSIYRPEALPYNVHGIPADAVDVVIRAARPDALIAPLRERLAGVSDSLELQPLVTMEQKLAATIVNQLRLNSMLQLLGGITVLLTIAGLYALLSYGVEMQRREFGVRQALGASAGRLMRGVLHQGMVLLAAALAIGGPLALLLGYSLRGRLHGIGPFDAVSLAATASLLIVATAAASLVPALRAARIQPAVALKGD